MGGNVATMGRGYWVGGGRGIETRGLGDGNCGSRSRSVHVLSEDGLGEILRDVREPASSPCIRHCIGLVLLFSSRLLEPDSFGFEIWRGRVSERR